MPRIHILPDRVANQIAAGEVVERPAAVVKELVENSLDAGATRIEIEFRHGGKSYLRIEDNGHGLSPDDALLALERHATSKIREAADLLNVRTFGFRGEALPSIASVSRFQLVSRAAGAAVGSEILVNGGKLLHQRATGCPVGTRIEVAHLFNSVPARRKFLKTDETESAHITRLARLYAVANPDVAFTLLEDGRVVFRSPSCPSLRERVAEIWGRRSAEELLEFPAVTSGPYSPSSAITGSTSDALLNEGLPSAALPRDGLRLSGLLGRPGQGRPTRDGLITLVNRRPVDSRTLSYAVLEAYHTYVPKGRYPPAILFLDIDPAAVDVNVHPAKREVRFRDEGRVRQFVLTTVLNRLRTLTGDQNNSLPSASPSATPAPILLAPPDASTLRSSAQRSEGGPPTPTPYPQPQTANQKPETSASAPQPLTQNSKPEPSSPQPQTVNRKPETLPTAQQSAIRNPQSSSPSLPSVPSPLLRFTWRLIGRWRGHVYLFETPAGLVLFNARAAHERVWFEDLQSRFAAAQAVSQRLLFPIPLELEPLLAAALAEHQPWLNRHGFALEEFGRNFYRLESVPDWLDPARAEPFLRDLAELARERGHAHPLRHEDIARLAATRALRLGDQPTDHEIRSLAQRLLLTKQPLTCPRGRPTFVELPASDLARRFGGDAEAL
jgi:DNA mismatch repair protein MutL